VQSSNRFPQNTALGSKSDEYLRAWIERDDATKTIIAEKKEAEQQANAQAERQKWEQKQHEEAERRRIEQLQHDRDQVEF
jgi:hypothetical protein